MKKRKSNEYGYVKKFDNITEKACLCLGLASSTLIKNEMIKSGEDSGVSVCPGPNLAYFSGKLSLRSMVNHIYGKINIIKRNDRPNFFVKELSLYIKYLKDLINDLKVCQSESELKKIQLFHQNLKEGIAYYKKLFLKHISSKNGIKASDLIELKNMEKEISKLTI